MRIHATTSDIAELATAREARQGLVVGVRRNAGVKSPCKREDYEPVQSTNRKHEIDHGNDVVRTILSEPYTLFANMTANRQTNEVDLRMPVWVALSELFLDTELQEEDHQRIARVLAASQYSEKKLDEILRFEVTPVLKWNLLSVAGEWAGFHEEWLREELVPKIDKRPLFRPRVFWMMRRRWAHILGLVSAIRADRQ